MASISDEFSLVPPRIMAEGAGTSGQPTTTTTGHSKKKLVELRIILQDNTLHALQLPVNCTGSECTDEICGILGIIEKDYFGLQFIDSSSGHKIWINKRLRIRSQINTKPPYTLYFCVKYYTQPQYLLQPSTIDAFFLELKSQIRRGDIHVPNPKKAIVGAHIAQAEMGDMNETNGSMVYPHYFPNWNSGISHIIRKEHRKLKGVAKRDAQTLFIMIVYELENYGMTYVEAIINGERVIVGIGSRYIRILTPSWQCKNRISFSSLTQVAFGNKFFSFIYCTRDEERNLQEKKLTAYVFNHTLAKSLFRTVTEDQVFHYQNTVTPLVLNHADTRETIWRLFCRKVLKRKYEKKYYYDIQRTKREAYRFNWQVLHQVVSSEVVTEPPEEPPVIYVNLPNNREEEQEEEEDLDKLKKKCEVWWGLSDSSINLAKELLPTEYITLSPSKELSLFTPSLAGAGGTASSTTRPAVVPLGNSSPPTELEGNSTQAPSAPGTATGSIGDAFPVVEAKPDFTRASEAASSSEEVITKEVLTADNVDDEQPLNKTQGRKMLRFLMKIQDEKLCNVCMDELISSVFCPCGHYVACERCAKRLDKCPVCRQPIGYVQFVYTK